MFVLLWIVSYIGVSLCSCHQRQRRWWRRWIRWMLCLVKIVCLNVVGSKRCRDTSREFDDGKSCFVFYGDKFLTWNSARNKCLRKGGDLATFLDVDSNVGLFKLATGPHWVGLRSSWWTWLDGCQCLSSFYLHIYNCRKHHSTVQYSHPVVFRVWLSNYVNYA